MQNHTEPECARKRIVKRKTADNENIQHTIVITYNDYTQCLMVRAVKLATQLMHLNRSSRRNVFRDLHRNMHSASSRSIAS